MANRRIFLSQLVTLGLGGAGLWWLRQEVIWPPPRVRFSPDGEDGGWLGWGAEDPVPVIPVSVEGRPALALVDSGAQASVLDQGVAAELGAHSLLPLPVVAFGVTGRPQLGRSASVSVQAAGATLEGLRTALLDLSPLRLASGRRIALVMGMNALSEMRLDLDAPRRRLAFRTPSAPLPRSAQPVAARLSGRELFVPVEVEGRPLEVVLDTGASSALSLSEPAARRLGLLDGRETTATASITFGGRAVHRTVVVDTLAFGGERLRRVPVQIYPAPAGSPLPAGLLGIEALRRLRLLADFGGGRLAVVPEPALAPHRRRRATAPA